MTHASLFTGIGGFDLAAERAGIKNIFQVEIDTFCLKVLEKNFPNVYKHEDIREFNGLPYRGTIDVLSGGFPCQKYSRAGTKSGNDPLKKELLRVVSEILPTWVVIENVHGFITPRFADEHNSLCKQLEGMDYEVQTFDIDGSSVSLSTLERHIWIIASRAECGAQRSNKTILSKLPLQGYSFPFYSGNKRKPGGRLLSTPRLCRGGERISNRMDRIKSLGNAILPDIAEIIFRIIIQMELEIL